MMNQLLMQMLAAQGGTANPMVADLLARMNSAGPGGGVNVEELLAQQAATNPIAAMFAKQFTAQKAAREAIDESRVIDMEAAPTAKGEEEAAMAAAIEARAKELNEMRERMNTVLTELELLRQRNDTLAAAVGACCLCWGQNIDCRSCRGRGGPGFCIPDESLFEEFVLPAIRTLRAQKAKNPSFSQQVQARTANA
jgi:hypothetical protein